jgi:hypothetical protein
LGVAAPAIERRLTSIRTKMDARSTTEAAVKAIKANLLGGFIPDARSA